MAMWMDIGDLPNHEPVHPVVRALACDADELRQVDVAAKNGLPGEEALCGGGLDDLLSLKNQYAVVPAEQAPAERIPRRGRFRFPGLGNPRPASTWRLDAETGFT
jgi:hypothetical protein